MACEWECYQADENNNNNNRKLNNKKNKNATKSSAMPCFMHSTTQVNNKIVLYGGSDYFGEAISQLLVLDTDDMSWSIPTEEVDMESEPGGPRYGHSSTLIESHPPRIVIFGGMQGGNLYSFEGSGSSKKNRATSMIHQNNASVKGKTEQGEEPDNGIYILECEHNTWKWNMPSVRGKNRPMARSEHTATKINSNQIFIMGGWSQYALDDYFIFDFIEMIWTKPIIKGKKPFARYRHTANLLGNEIYIMGGSDNGDDIAERFKDSPIYIMNVKEMAWSIPDDIMGHSPFPRSGHASCSIGHNAIAVFGGKLNNQVFYDDLHILNVNDKTWTRITNTAQSPLCLTTASMNIWKQKLIIFGGTDNKAMCYNDVYVGNINSFFQENDYDEMSAHDYNFKILVVGNSAVGKSALLTRFSQDVFDVNYTTTLGIDFSSKTIRIQDKVCKLDIWDTAGQERYSAITTSYYRGAQGALIVYDITSEESFENIEQWTERVEKFGGKDLEMILVGNKSDMAGIGRQVEEERGQALADKLGIPFLETSAKAGINVNHAFMQMSKNIKLKVEANDTKGISTNFMAAGNRMKLAGVGGIGNSTSKNKKCC